MNGARLVFVDRAIVEFERDDVGDWVALLECGHRQHVRHKPPFLERPWVQKASGRQLWLGRPLNCRVCAQELDALHTGVREGGDPPCLAERLCPECGAVVDGPGGSEGPGGSKHRPRCSRDAAGGGQ